ncbi:MAG: thioredoxin family protein [Candidatus Thorarchaeota archaeon]
MSKNGERIDGQIKGIAERLEAAMTRTPDEPLANGTLNELPYENFMDTVRQPKTAIIEFYTNTCPYCRQMKPVLDELASDYKSKVYFAKINIEEQEEAATTFDVEGVPLIMAFKKGNPVAKIEGLRSIHELDRWIESIHRGLRPLRIEPGPVTKVILGDI